MFAKQQSIRPFPITKSLVFVIMLSLLSAGSPTALKADNGHPIALRKWPNGQFSIETMWNLKVGVGVTDENAIGDNPTVNFHARDLEPGQAGILRRPANERDAIFIERAEDKAHLMLANDIEIERISIKEDRQQAMTVVRVDGSTFLFLNDSSVINATTLNSPAFVNAVGADEKTAFTIIATSKAFDDSICGNIAKQLKPATMVVGPHVASVSKQPVIAVSHNTLLVASKHKPIIRQTRFVSLAEKPYEMTEELAELFAKKEAASAASRAMFSKLSVEQMNFRPPNETHTPRWNAEHMMGRELLFFSQIYHAVDPRIEIMNLNPKQMPKDYRAAHPDWSGFEEAQQMERVEAFTRRFAFLLDGMELDEKAQGSKFWTPRGLLEQMERHYNEHSANVVKKMELETWPSK